MPGKNYDVRYTPGAAANDVLMAQQVQQPVPQAPAAAPAPAPAAPQLTPEVLAAMQAAGVDISKIGA